MSKLCDVCGMDPRLLCYEWEATVIPNDKLLTPRHLSFMSGLWSSTSIDRSKASRGLNMATKHEEWKVGFGPLVADALYRHAEKAMADYEYLRSRRV
ncbi:hypothetical protein O9K51_04393 [Purpureocillium lavendulum]|uniref:Uncharacterized protein n=1 Tax=Purpureocillium lavendulum TaxID=1247861 RepID=A0AB34FV22_9HYPO|nr:hypothetical protein O9K51_04393 [Purpureocillium lavendulum]